MGIDSHFTNVILHHAEVEDTLQIFGQLLLRYANIFNAGDRFVIATAAHENVETGLAHRPDIVDARRVKNTDHGSLPTPFTQMLLQVVDLAD